MLQYLSSNLRGYRQQAGLSKWRWPSFPASAAACWRASRPAIATSAAVLDKIAAATAISFTDLIGRRRLRQPYGQGLARQGAQPGSGRCSPPAYRRGSEPELWEWTLMPGERYDSAPDAEGWSEMIYVIAGILTLELEQDTLTLTAGAVQTFNSDQRYAYANHGDPLRFIRNVAF